MWRYLLFFVVLPFISFNIQAMSLNDFERVVARNLEYRSQSVQFNDYLVTKLKATGHLTAQDLVQLKEQMSTRVKEQKALLGQMQEDAEGLWSYFFTGTFVDFQKGMRALALGILFIDNYLLATTLYEKQPILRRLLNERDSSFGQTQNALSSVTKEFYSRTNNMAKLYALGVYKKVKAGSKNWFTDKYMKVLQSVIESSFYWKEVAHYNDIRFVEEELRLLFTGLDRLWWGSQDVGFRVWDRFVFGVSKAFGNSAGEIQWRKGKLWENAKVAQQMKDAFQPLDVVFDKIGAKLTDKVIPGYWGHVGVWLGTEDQLRALGVWNHPKIVPHQAKIRAGKGIVEALRKEGVTMNNVEHFLNIDSTAIMRRYDQSDEEKRAAILRLVSQIGKKYDFSFDSESGSSIVCSELVFWTFIDVDFSLSRMLGRWTIDPDAVARESFPGGIFEPILLYHDGKELTGDLREQMQNLVERDVKIRIKPESTRGPGLYFSQSL